MVSYLKIDQHAFTSWQHWPAGALLSFLPSSEPLHLRYLNMSFAGARQFVASNNTFYEAKTVSRMFIPSSKLTALDGLQINFNYSNRTTSDGVIPVMPNPSNRFTGRTAYVSKLERYFCNSDDSARKRKLFLLHGMGGIGKTQISLKFLEETSDL